MYGDIGSLIDSSLTKNLEWKCEKLTNYFYSEIRMIFYNVRYIIKHIDALKHVGNRHLDKIYRLEE